MLGVQSQCGSQQKTSTPAVMHSCSNALLQVMSSNLCAYRTRYTSATTVLQSMSIYYANRTTDGLQEQFFNLDI